MDITVGMKGEAVTQVEKEDTAQEVGSGELLVYATPCMAALMEGAACNAIAACIPEGADAVISEQHAQLLDFLDNDENTLTDEAGEIGHGTHTRVIVNSQKFLDKTYQKL